jgi:HK97 family phage portal protein
MFFKIEIGRKRKVKDASPAIEQRTTTIEDPGVPVNAKNIIDVFGMPASRSGVTVNEETALTFSAVYSCVTLISDSIGSIPLNVFRYTKEGKEIYVDHPLYRMLHDEPCEMYSSAEWRQLMQASALLWGNGYSKIIRDKYYIPQWVDWIPPSIVQPYQIVRADGTKSLRYKITTTGEIIDAVNMIHIKAVTFDGIIGKSPIEIARDNIGLGLAAEHFGSEFFANGASFNGILHTDQVLKKDQVDIVKNSWQSSYTGEGKRFKTPFLPFGVKYDMIGVPPEQAQFIQTRKFQIGEIARIFRVPLHMLADLEKSSFSNIEHQGIEFVTTTLRPWCVKWEQELNRKLLPESDKGKVYTKFNLEGLLRGDSTARAAYLKTMVEMDIYTRNEAREYEDKNPLPGLDEPFSKTKYQSNSKTEDNGTEISQ